MKQIISGPPKQRPPIIRKIQNFLPDDPKKFRSLCLALLLVSVTALMTIMTLSHPVIIEAMSRNKDNPDDRIYVITENPDHGSASEQKQTNRPENKATKYPALENETAVEYVKRYKIMSGYEDSFGENDPVTPGQYTVILSRMIYENSDTKLKTIKKDGYITDNEYDYLKENDAVLSKIVYRDLFAAFDPEMKNISDDYDMAMFNAKIWNMPETTLDDMNHEITRGELAQIIMTLWTKL